MKNPLTLGYSIIIPNQKQTVSFLGNDYEAKINGFVNYANSIYNPELDYTVNPLIKKENDGNKRRCYQLTTSIRNNKDDKFNGSNVVFVDIDDTKDEVVKFNGEEYNFFHKISDHIHDEVKDYMFEMFPNLLAYQKSYSGGMHLIFEIPFCDTEDEWKSYAEYQYEYFKEKFVDCISFEDKEVLKYMLDRYMDTHNLSINQKLFVCKNEVIYNNNEIILTEFEESFKSLKLTVSIYNSNLFKEDDQFEGNLNQDSESTNDSQENQKQNTFIKFTDNITVPDIDNSLRINLQYDITQSEVYKACKDLSNYWGITLSTYTKYLRVAIPEETLYNIKLVPFILRDDKGNIKRINQGGGLDSKGNKYRGRRYNIMCITKVAILNAYATMKHKNANNIDYYGILNTIAWYIDNCIEIFGHSRVIDDIVIRDCIKNVYYNWNDLNVDYKFNSGWYKDAKKEDEDIMDFLHRYGKKVRNMKFNAVEKTVLNFIKNNNLAGKSGKYIADLLIANNIQTKTKYKWSEKAVNRMLAKFNLKTNTDDYSTRLEELYSEGKKYGEIASILNNEGYTTKQGKEINAKTIENYVSRKLKNKSDDTEEFLIIEKVRDEIKAGYKYEEIAETLSVAFGKTFNENDIKNIVRRNLK